MRTTAGIILQVSISIILFCFSYGIRKEKANLLTNSVVCSCSCSCSASHYYTETLDKENKDGAGLFV